VRVIVAKEKPINYNLIIDDCPSRTFRKKIEFLHKHGITAKCFCMGKLLAGRIDEAVEAVELGFELGNHSYNHPKFTDITKDKAIDEVNLTEMLINYVYKKAGVGRIEKMFRYPYNVVAHEDIFSDFVIVNFNYDIGEYNDWLTKQTLRERIREMKIPKEATVLIHDHGDNEELFYTAISELYKFDLPEDKIWV